MFNKVLSIIQRSPVAPEQSLLCQHTIIGDRSCNEDALGCVTVKTNEKHGHFLIVCDGMGGHVAGDITAQTLVKCFIEQVGKLKNPLTLTAFQTLYKKSISEMKQYVKENHGEVDGHTTLACAWIDEEKILTLHVGDSRVYQLDSTQVKFRTRDHSVVQMLLDEGEISEEEMGTHPEQNKLFKSIGVLNEELDKPSIKQYSPLTAGESILVCSDGFWEHLSQKELVKLNNKFSQKSLEKSCDISQIRANGKSDNISVIVFKQGKS
ncbi:MAG: serine/threonine-protein phosphatase [Saccharospirillaceae bacterium]|nr:serine/threonine-protein phosphatase [Colwellia sp.]NRB77599.1 serine/threonine-protein phosphatase [Saccharospirillaceae bacterium]